MKARLFIMGIDKGEIELGENSLFALLLKGQLAQSLQVLNDMKTEIETISPGTKVDFTISKEPPTQNLKS